ncbi:MAG: heavy metal translocating P-type ATPase [Acidobacteriota bacterium]
MASTCTVCELHAESTFKVEGMDCRDEVVLIERRFKHLRGLEAFSADVIGQRLLVQYDAAKLSASAITGAVADAGMRAWLEHEEPIVVGHTAARRRHLLVCLAAISFGAGMVLETFGPATPWLARAAYAVTMAAGGTVTVRRAWAAVRALSLDINVLMLIAATGAVILDQWSEAAAVIVLFAIAQMLEARTLERARHAVGALLDLSPADALVRGPAGERRIGVDQIAPGALIVIKPGEKIPLDGEIVAGQSEVNQAPVTGESLPVDKAPGDDVFAGTINGRGALEVRVTRVRRDTTLARIIHLVEQAQAQRAPAQTLVDRFARVYTPAVVGIAILVATLPPLLGGAAWQPWLYRALVLLVVSCPCALVISTPVSIVAALAGAARKGVLIKGGTHLEQASRVRCIAFDKTGTLTRGTPDVVAVMSFDARPERAIVALAAAIEGRSEHPIGRAILQYAAANGIAALPGDDVRALAGRGAEGRVGGVSVLVGNHRVFEERGLCSPDLHWRLDDLTAAGRTAVLVAHDDRAVGLIAVADQAREGGREAIDMLRRQGIESLVLLTGDSLGPARALAEQLGLDEFQADLLPEQKVAAIADLRRRFGPVAMVGDGVNDAPALASADLGLAMGAAGTDAALETADVALMADRLLEIPYLFRLGRATVRNIRVNLAISLIMKAAFVALAVTGMATLWMAVVADTGASIIVIANALRLRRAG